MSFGSVLALELGPPRWLGMLLALLAALSLLALLKSAMPMPAKLLLFLSIPPSVLWQWRRMARGRLHFGPGQTLKILLDHQEKAGSWQPLSDIRSYWLSPWLILLEVKRSRHFAQSPRWLLLHCGRNNADNWRRLRVALLWGNNEGRAAIR